MSARAPDWPIAPSGQSMHRVLLRGRPDLEVSIHGRDPVEPSAAGGG